MGIHRKDIERVTFNHEPYRKPTGFSSRRKPFAPALADSEMASTGEIGEVAKTLWVRVWLGGET